METKGRKQKTRIKISADINYPITYCSLSNMNSVYCRQLNDRIVFKLDYLHLCIILPAARIK